MKYQRLLVILGCTLAIGWTVSCTNYFDDDALKATSITVPKVDVSERFPGGAASSLVAHGASLEHPSTTLPAQNRPSFFAGRALANQPWVIAPTITTARDGLGPYFHQRTCLACHNKGGKGLIPENNNQLLDQAVVRLSLPSNNQGAPIPEPVYGTQLQIKSISVSDRLGLPNVRTDLPAEAKVYLEWLIEPFTYPDGQQISLRRPTLDIKKLGYGALHSATQKSLRAAPSIQGMGLIEAIPAQQILALADPQDADQDGVSGRANWLTATPSDKALGRFGLKASMRDLNEAVAAAFHQDLGISTPVFPSQTCTSLQTACRVRPTGDDLPLANTSNSTDTVAVEVPQKLLDLVVGYIRHLAVPARHKDSLKETRKGRTLFYQNGCSGCHQPSFTTDANAGDAALANLTIYPYSDFLLHDMGEELADHRPDFSANGREWRTAPLWSAGLHKRVNGNQFYLHDGRARTIEEAILWHGGEAHQSRQNFTLLAAHERQQLINFVRSL